jgi:histidine ammonia-lyase
MNESTVSLDGYSLTLEQVETVARKGAPAALTADARRRVQASARTLNRLAVSHSAVYGVNTGFGVFADRRIDPSQSARLSRNLILSHAAGVGPAFATDVTRAAMLIRANTLCSGHSGVRVELVETLLGMLRLGITPVIPAQGSLGSSGDLAPLAHLALVLSRDPEGEDDHLSGQAWYGGRMMSGAEAMQAATLARLVLGPKEGLALTNGATFAAALIALACVDVERLLHAVEIATAMGLEAILGASAAFDERIHQARPHPGQRAVAARVRALTVGSTLLDRAGRVQDAYSLRCSPQIIGPAWEILDFVRGIARRELNSATDNPLLFGGQVLSGGNFHGEPLGLAADYLKIALSEVGAASERRGFRLLDGNSSAGLPPMLVGRNQDAGLNSGLMMLQYTAASLCLENQSLAAPDSVRSLPTSAGQEDHNANATTAARHLADLIANLRHILAIELLINAQALDLRLESLPQARPGSGVAAAHALIRGVVPFRTEDHPLSPDIESVSALIDRGAFLGVLDSVGR